VLAAALVISHLAWQRAADRRLAAAKALFEKQGISLNWQAMETPEIPDAENAVVPYLQAHAQIALLNRRQVALLDEVPGNSTLRARYVDKVDELLSSCQGAVDLCRQAAARKKAYWAIKHTTPGFSSRIPSLLPQRRLVRLLCLLAERQADKGQSDEALQSLILAEAAARAYDGENALLMHLFRMSCLDRVVTTAGEIAPQVELAGPGPSAAREVLRMLIGRFLQDSSSRPLQEGFVHEAAIAIDSVEYCSNHPSEFWKLYAGTPGGLEPVAYLKPATTVDEALIVSQLHKLIELAEKEQMAGQLPPSILDHPGVSLRLFAHLVGVLRNPLGRAVQITAENMALCRLAAIRLAMRLFELERGRTAASLDELVPDYLPAVPADPMDPNGGPIRAKLNDPDPRIYSLGDNGLDDGGTGTPGFWHDPDIVMYLKPKPGPQPAVWAISDIEGTPPPPATDPATSPAAGEETPASASDPVAPAQSP
jgi:hypothetical protein